MYTTTCNINYDVYNHDGYLSNVPHAKGIHHSVVPGSPPTAVISGFLPPSLEAAQKIQNHTVWVSGSCRGGCYGWESKTTRKFVTHCVLAYLLTSW